MTGEITDPEGGVGVVSLNGHVAKSPFKVCVYTCRFVLLSLLAREASFCLNSG